MAKRILSLVLVLLLFSACVYASNGDIADGEYTGGEYTGEGGGEYTGEGGGEYTGEGGENSMLPPPSEEADNAAYRVFIGGEYHAYDVPPEVTEDGVLMLPLYAILEADGATVIKNGAAAEIVTRKNKTIGLNLSDGKYRVIT
ncbi:MAG: hypothetical protein LBU58_11710, partial [Clostridiales bacterium]|nr:hypothetical protein [Clostridiales bacterium]